MKSRFSSRLPFLALSLLVVVPLIGGGLARARSEQEEDDFYKHLSVFVEVLRLVRQVYVEPTEIQALMAGALDGAADALDPFSIYVPAQQVDVYLAAERVGRSRSGILVLKDRGVAYVVTVDRGGPGEAAGVERGDILSKLDGLSSRDMPLWKIRELLAGSLGSSIELEVVRRGEAIPITVTLGDFAAQEPVLEELDGVAVLRLRRFLPDVGDKLPMLLRRAAGKPLLIDVRGAAGDDPEIGFRVAEAFATGELGQLRSRTGVLETYSAKGEPAWTGPVAVLMDHGSQGPPEVLASVLKQQLDAPLIGQRSYGHAGRLSRVNLSSGAFLELTDAFYTGPDGERLSEGLKPDLSIDLVPFGAEESEREILERAVELFLEHQQGERAAA